MNEARKALIKIQTAPPGVPVGRFSPQLAIIADFFDNLVNLKIENTALHMQVLEAHERFGKLLGAMAIPAGSVPDQAQTAVAFGIDAANPGADKTVFWPIPVAHEPQPPAGYKITDYRPAPWQGSVNFSYAQWLSSGWNDEQLIKHHILVPVPVEPKIMGAWGNGSGRH